MKNSFSTTFILVSMLLVSQLALAEKVYQGTDNKGLPCALHIADGIIPVLDEEVHMNVLTAQVKTSYSDVQFKVKQSVSLNDDDKIELSKDLKGALADEYQGELIAIELSSENTPTKFSYYNNTGFRYFKPIQVTCTLN